MSTLKSKQIQTSSIYLKASPEADQARAEFYKLLNRAAREGGIRLLEHADALLPILKQVNASIDKLERREARYARV